MPRGDETLLVVEDEGSVRELAVDVLKSLGYRVLEASNGGEALLLLEKHEGPVNLLITDVIMPHMSGKELAAKLKEKLPDMKVLYTTGYTENVIYSQGILEPGTILLQKPFTPSSLARKVREVLGKP